MSTTSEVIAACNTAKDNALTAKVKWAAEASLLNTALGSATAGSDTSSALTLGVQVSETTRDAMNSASDLYNKISNWDIITMPKTLLNGTVFPNTVSVPSTINFDLVNNSLEYYVANSSGLDTVNFRATSTQPLSSVMTDGQVISGTLILTSSSNSSFTFKIDGISTGISTMWETYTTGTGGTGNGNTYSMVGYKFTIIRTGTDQNTQIPTYMVLVSTARYSSSFQL